MTASLLLERPATTTVLLERPATTTVRYAFDVPEPSFDVADATTAAFRRGDDTALRMAYDEHGSLVYSYCRRSLAEDRAKDVTQEVFVSAWRNREQFDPSRGSLAAWLMGITKNRLIDNVRAEGRHENRRADDETGEVSVEADVDRISDRMLVADALDQLPARSRQVIELAYFGDLTHQQVAERTSLPLGTVKSDIRRGLAAIRQHLEVSHV